jgi:serine/threonine protein kinase
VRYQPGLVPVPGYRLESFLGEGSYGEVWKAVGPGGVKCALKFISQESSAGLKEFRSINLVKHIHHPNLVPITAVWLRDADGTVMGEGSAEDSYNFRSTGPKELVIAMGLGQKTLAHRLDETRRAGGIPPRELIGYMRDAARGIDFLNEPAHDLGGADPTSVIHCDIKPANLLVVGRGVQVCDYGVAKSLVPDARKTFAAGTPAYAPPELINGEPCVQTDQYSLAITYYELRTGTLPFDEARALSAHLMGELDFGRLPAAEREIVTRATSKRPAGRFESCEEMIELLAEAARPEFEIGRSSVIAMPGHREKSDSGPLSGGYTPVPQPGSQVVRPPTPRPGSHPEVRLTPAAEPIRLSTAPPPVRQSGTPKYAGTVGFDDVLPPSDARETPDAPRETAPYRPPAAPPKQPWDDEERSPSKLPALAALAVGGLALLAVVGGGVYYVATAKPTDSASAATTLTTKSSSGETPVTTPIIPAVTPPTKTNPVIPPPPPPPDEHPQPPPPPPPPDTRTAEALTAIRARKLGDAVKLLKEVAAAPDKDAAAWATALLAACEKLKAAAAAPVTDGAALVALADSYRGLADTLPDADRDAIQAAFKATLAGKVASAVPGLTAETDWAKVGEVCAAAEKSPWVDGCRWECARELGETKGSSPPATPAGADAALTDYFGYLALRAKPPADAADRAAKLAGEASAKLPSASPLRQDRLTELLLGALRPLRVEAKGGLSPAYKPEDTDKARRWAAAADAAAVKGGSPRVGAVRLDRVLVEGAAEKPDTTAVARLAADAATTAAVKQASQREQAQYWSALAHANVTPTAAYSNLLTLASDRRNDLGPTAVYDAVIKPLLKPDRFKGLKASAPGATETADLLRKAALELASDKADWAGMPGFPADGPQAAAGRLFGEAYRLGEQSADLAWRGLCVAGTPDPDFAALDADLKRAKAADPADPAVLTLAGVVEARRPRRDTPRPDLKAQIAAAGAAHSSYLKAIARCEEARKAEPTRDRELLGRAYKLAADNAIFLANFETLEPAKQKAHVEQAAEWAGALLNLNPGQYDALDTMGCAWEDRAWIAGLKRTPAEAESDYAEADRKFQTASNLPGAKALSLAHRGRNLVKWARAGYYATPSDPHPERLREAEGYLKRALKQAGKADGPAVVAECHYWLGECAALRIWALGPGERDKVSAEYAEAVRQFAATLVAAAGGGDAFDWADAATASAFFAHRDQGRRLVGWTKYADAEKVADAIDALAATAKPAPSPAWQATMRVEALRLRERCAESGTGTDWFDRLDKAIEPGLGECLTQDLGAQLELRALKAELRNSPLTYPAARNLKAAADIAKEAAAAACNAKLTPAHYRATALGTHGFVSYVAGVGGDNDKKTTWGAAAESLREALQFAPSHERAWKWRFALADILAVGAMEAANGNGDALKARSLRVVRDGCDAIDLIRGAAGLAGYSAALADADDRAFAERVRTEKADYYKGLLENLITPALKNVEGGSVEALLAAVLSAELDWVADAQKAAALDAARAKLREATAAKPDPLATRVLDRLDGLRPPKP